MWQPDATAPGVGILASTIPAIETGDVPFGKKPSNFAIKSGTSMACPHVTGAAAYLKSAHPTWTPSMIKSALMTTGRIRNRKFILAGFLHISHFILQISFVLICLQLAYK